MTLDRRTFLGSAALVATAILAGPATAVAATPAHAKQAVKLPRSMFEPLIGQTASASGAGRQARIRLVTLRDLAGAPAGSQASFLLQFSSATALPDGLYTLRHPIIGSRQLFLCGVDRGPARRYEAVVNQATGKQ
jgi:hypothetical protein